MLPLTPPVFAILSALLEERTGIHYGQDDASLLADKLSTRASIAGFDSLLDYYYFLRYDDPKGDEFRALVSAIVVNETYFFREYDQLLVVVDRFLAPLVREGRRARVWSAACSTGEEPLTLAMMLAERGLLDGVEIVASDISEKALARAKSGSFGKRALRDPPAIAARYITDVDGTPRVDERARNAVRWERVNLVEPAEVAAMGTFDVVLCRNVLIYFSDDYIRRVVSGLTAALRLRGALFVGVSESLLRFTTELACEEVQGVFCYRRPT